MKKVAIVGSRGFCGLPRVRNFIWKLPSGTTVISGGAKGVDLEAEMQASDRGLKVIPIKPDYEKYGRYEAPKVRNKQIAQECDEMYAFWDGKSGGTANAVMHALSLGKRVKVFLEVESD